MVKNGLYNLVGGVIRLGLGVLTVPFLIQILGIKEYGLYAIVNAVLLFAMLSEWSISVSMTVFLAPAIESDRSSGLFNTNKVIKASSIVVILLSSVTAVLLGIVTLFFSNIFTKFSSPEVAIISQCSKLGVLLVWIRLSQQLFVGIEQAYQQYGPSNIINTLFGILISLGTLLTAYISHSLIMIFYYQFVMTFLSMFIHGWFCFQKRFISLSFWHSELDKGQVSEMVRYSLKALTGTLGGTLFTQGDRILVGNLLGSEAVGIYAALTNVAGQINNLSAMPLQTIIPEISQAQEQINKGVEQSVVHSFNPQKILSAYEINLFLALLLGAGIIGLAPEALMFLSLTNIHNYNVTFLTRCFIFLGVIYSTYSVNALGYYVLLALRETSIFLTIQLLSGVITLIAIAWLSHVYGLSGAIAGNALFLSTFIGFTWFSAQKLTIPIGNFIRVSILPFCLFIVFFCLCSISHTEIALRLCFVILFSTYAVWRLILAVQAYKINEFIFKPA